MATTNPSVVRAVNSEAQSLFTISFPYVDTHPNLISGVSKADPAVVTMGPSTTVISATGTVGNVAGSGPYTATITGMTTTAGLVTGQIITATDGVGSLGTGTAFITAITGNKSVTIQTVDDTPVAGAITDISVTSPTTLPVGFIDGTAVIIEDVAGMTQLATAGEDGTNKFYISVVDTTSFSLYSDSTLSTSVDSTGFSTATANTGYFQTFSVPQYNTTGSTATVMFNSTTNTVGTDISLDFATGLFTLTGGTNTYQLVATANINVPGATYQWYDFTNNATVGSVAFVGSPVTGLFKNDNDADIGLVVTSAEGTVFGYPTQITNVQAVVDVISGFVA